MEKKKKVVVAFSGGLDTSFTVMYLAKEKGYEVYAACANTGGFSPEQLKTNEENAYKLGAKEYVTIDVTQEYYEKSLRYMVFGNVLRNGTYPISVSSERIFQALAIARYANEIGIDSETARLVFTSKQGEGVAATIVDLGNRFRLIVNKVECIKSKPLPKLPVASALWIPMPNLEVGAAAWILAGGTHHTSFSYDLTVEYWEDFAEMAGIEMVVIDENTTISEFKKELRMNEVYYMLNKALC